MTGIRTDWAAQYAFTNGTTDYAFCDDRAFAERIKDTVRSTRILSITVVRRSTGVMDDGERISSAWEPA